MSQFMHPLKWILMTILFFNVSHFLLLHLQLKDRKLFKAFHRNQNSKICSETNVTF